MVVKNHLINKSFEDKEDLIKEFDCGSQWSLIRKAIIMGLFISVCY